MGDNILHDSPREFLSDVVSSGECDAQSVIPDENGVYQCGCSCKAWSDEADSIEHGLELARAHCARISATRA